ncbi:hypothetical protein LB545_07520 [Mesorhizobium sp. BR1-1-6]|uniref:hypothetical protein n=1 Tax=Mesorhizobium sp. BR1-1-6 TaxID=2876648 RepID=UPI001CD184B1|nr:hypothetical protein [Mesorhizobium sp. BR1-1-6]MBZ9894191.1 hypothetical protein [Mesorhizobium sp. BR1-1-6]
MGEQMKHLWEVDHPYYMNEGNYFSNGCHETYPAWDVFESQWRDADLDYNWFVRWDWLEGEDSGAGEFNGDVYYRNGILKLQIIGQRKSYLGSHEVSVCRADEPRVIAFLAKYWEYMKAMWEPFSGDGNG